MISDFIVAAGGLALAGYLRFGNQFRSAWELDALPSLLVVIPTSGILTVGLFWLAGAYHHRLHVSFSSEVRDVLRAVALAGSVTVALLYLLRLQEVSRLMLVYWFVLMMIGAIASRFLVGWAHRRDVNAGRTSGALIVVGARTDRQRFLDSIRHAPDFNLEVVGYLGPHEDDATDLVRLGATEDLAGVLARSVIDEVVVCLPFSDWDSLDAITDICAQQGVPVRVPVPVAANTLSRGNFENFNGLPLLSLVAGPERTVALAVKRIIDIVLALVMVVLLTPLWVAVTATAFVVHGRPIIFSQVRGGRRGRPFRILKFRTMQLDAEEKKADLASLNERVGPAFKVTADPRVTRLGRWLRKTSIDESPQLLNVLRGEMSLVGPRPQPLEEVEAYDFWHRRRLSMKPGITGLWQVTARHDNNFDRWVDLDLQYIDRWSLWMDFVILMTTPLAMVRTPGV